MRTTAIAVFAIAIVVAGCGASAGSPTWTFAPEIAVVAASPTQTPSSTAPSTAAVPSPAGDISGIVARTESAVDGGTPADTDPTAASVRIADFAFGPATATIRAGGRVTWTNADGDRHSVLIGGAESGRLEQGGTFSRAFAEAGRFAYVCGIHESMSGTIVVLAGGFAAVTPANESTSAGSTATDSPAADPTASPSASPDDRDDDGDRDDDRDDDHSGHGRGGDDADDDEDHSGRGGGGSGHG